MNLMKFLPLISQFFPGLSQEWKKAIAAAGQEISGYRNTPEDLRRAIAERGLKFADIQQGMKYLQGGPVAGILNALQPGMAQQMQNIFSGMARDLPKGEAGNGSAAPHNTQDANSRWENPFPPLS